MQIRFDNPKQVTRALKPLAQLAKRASPYVEVLRCLHLTAGSQGAVVRATDLEVSAQVETPADVTAPGEACVDAGALLDVLKSASSPIDLTVDGDGADLRAWAASPGNGADRTAIPAQPAREYPIFPAPPESASWIEVPAGSLAHVAACRYAVYTDADRPGLAGCLLRTRPSRIEGIACDGHRLALLRAPAGEDIPDLLLPPSALAILADVDATRVSYTATHAWFQGQGITICARRLDATYPDIDRVIPARKPGVGVPVKPFLAAVKAMEKRAAWIVIKREKAWRTVGVQIGGFGLRVSARDENGQESSQGVVLATSAPVQESSVVCFNARYLTEALAHCSGKVIELQLGAQDEPALLHDGDDLHLVMSVRQ